MIMYWDQSISEYWGFWQTCLNSAFLVPLSLEAKWMLSIKSAHLSSSPISSSIIAYVRRICLYIQVAPQLHDLLSYNITPGP